MSSSQFGVPPNLRGWVLHEKLGAGGMGTVWRASKDGTEAAIKLVSSAYASDPGFRARFRREIVISQLAESSRIAKVLDYDIDASTPWLATTLLDGGTLEELILRSGPLDPASLGTLAGELAEAVSALGAAGIVHRDIKPSNVMMTSNGAVLVDLGIAHAADLASITHTGMRIGSPGWMAPEQVDGQKATNATDVFAWGLCVAYAGTGMYPFGTGPAEAVLLRVRHDAPQLDGLDPRWTPIVRSALSKDPAHRPPPADLMRPASAPGSPLQPTLPSNAPSTVPNLAAPPPPARDSAPTVGMPPLEGFPHPAPGRAGHRRGMVLGAVAVVLLTAIGAAGLTAVLTRRAASDAPSAGARHSPRADRKDAATASTQSTPSTQSTAATQPTTAANEGPLPCTTLTPSETASWTTYALCTNDFAGYRIGVPTAMGAPEETSNGNEQLFTADDPQITLQTFKRSNPTGADAEQAAAAATRAMIASGGQAPTYHPAKDRWFVISGYDAEGLIYYEREFVFSHAVYGYMWRFPKDMKAALTPALDSEIDSFVPGVNTPPDAD